MSYADTVDHQARRFGAGGTVGVFLLAAAGFFLDISMPMPARVPVKDRSLVIFPVPGVQEKQSDLKVFDVPEPVKPDTKPKPQPVEEPPQEEQKASSSSDEVDKSKPDPDQAAALAKLDMPVFWTPPPPKVEREQVERKEIEKVELPKLVVNDDRSEKKMDVNRPPRLIQAREQRMDDAEVMAAVRRLQQQVSSAPRQGTAARPNVVNDEVIDDGTVALRFQVLADGRISGCSVAVSSGSDVLDKRACELVSSFVYEPGTDENGGKVEKTMIETIEWLGGDAVRRSDVTPQVGSADQAAPRR